MDFLIPVPVDVEDAEVSREAPAPERAAGRMEEDEIVRGAGAAMGVDDVVAAGAEGARPITGGVDVRGVPGAEPLGVAGFDQDSKKSSSVSSLGAGAAGASIPSTKIPAGNLGIY